MRYLFASMCVLSLLISPLGASAQATKEVSPPPTTANGHSAQPADTQPRIRGVQRWHPEAFVAPESAEVTQFEIDYVTSTPLQRAQLEEQERRRKRRITIGVSVSMVLVVVAAGVTAGVASSMFSGYEESAMRFWLP